MEITFRLPNGQIISNPTLNQVLQKLNTTEQAFWKIGSGDAGLERTEDSTREQLHVRV
jgi:hypothetical protein